MNINGQLIPMEQKQIYTIKMWKVFFFSFMWTDKMWARKC